MLYSPHSTLISPQGAEGVGGGFAVIREKSARRGTCGANSLMRLMLGCCYSKPPVRGVYPTARTRWSSRTESGVGVGQIFTQTPCGQVNKQMCSPGPYITGKCRRSLYSSAPKCSSSREGPKHRHIRGAFVTLQFLTSRSCANPVILKHTE